MRRLATCAPALLLLAACSGGGAETAKLAGAPCPTLTAAAFQARGIEMEESMKMGSATLRFRFGRAECNSSGSSGGGWDSSAPVCHLSSPGLLHLTLTSGKEVHFDPGIGTSVAVSMGADEAQCVLETKPMP